MEENKLIVFNVGEELYGIDIKKVMGIERKQEIISVPNTPDCIKGIINLRGDVIPIYSFRTKFNKEELVGDDEGIILGHSGNDLIDIIPAGFDAFHIFFTHPAGTVTCEVGVAEIEEGEVDVDRLQDADRFIGKIIVCFEIRNLCATHKAGIGELAGAYKVAKLVPAVEERACFTLVFQGFAKTVDRSYLGHIGVCRGAVSCGIHTMEKRHMAGQRNGRHNRSCRHRAFAACDDFLCLFDICQGVGTHTVRQNKHDSHRIPPKT